MRTEPLRANLSTSSERLAPTGPGAWLGSWFTQQWGSHWSQLSSSEQAGVQQSWGRGSLPALKNLSQETRTEIFWSDLIALARGAEQNGGLPLARSLYGAIAERHPNSPEARVARGRLALMDGGGELGERIAWSTTRLVEQVTDPGLLLGMGVGASGFFLSRGALLRLMGSNTLGRRALATVGGMATEVPAMVLTTRGVHHFIPPSNGMGQMSLLEEMRHLGLSLVALRGAGTLTHRLVGNMATSSLAARALPQAAMFNGILAMRGLEIALGFSPTPSPQAFLVDALALQIQFNAMNRLVPHLGRRPIPVEPAPRIPTPRIWAPALAFGSAGSVPALLRPDPLGPGSQVLMSVRHAPSSRPPAPSGDIPVVSVRRPSRSGVQLKANRGEFEPVIETLSRLDHEMHLFLIEEGLSSPRWHSHSLSSLSRTREALISFQREMEGPPLGKGSLPHLPELIREIEHSHRLLSEFDPATRAGAGERGQAPSSHLLDFFNNQYAVPNKMINFFNGQAPLVEVLASARRSRRALQDFIESHQLPQGPVFGNNINTGLVETVQGLGAKIFRAYMFQSRKPWQAPTLEAVQAYENFIRQTILRFENSGKPQIYLEETGQAHGEIQQTVHHLAVLKDSARPALEGEALESTLNHLYKSPQVFSQFLETGRLSYLRTSRDHIEQANQILKSQAN